MKGLNFNFNKKEGKHATNKRKIFTVALATCLIAIISFGTLAWFTDEDTVVNKFYVGDTTTDADKVFGIDLWEDADKDGDGIITEDETYGKDTKDDTGITYETILPGEVFDKNPYFTNTGVHGQYLRAIVTVSEADILKEAMTPKGSDVSEWFNVEYFLPGTDEKWSLEYKYYTNKDTFVFVYYYTEVLEAGKTTEKLFDAVVIPTELTKEQAAEMDNFSVSILGQVIQSEHLADVTTAKEAFAKYWDEEGVVAGVTEDDLAVAGDTVANSSPLTGTLTAADTLIVYDDTLYNQDDPELRGVFVINDLTATIKPNVSMITIPEGEEAASIMIYDATFIVEDGGKIITSNSDRFDNQILVIGTVTINGEKMNSANKAEMIEKYFSGIATDNFYFY